MLEILRKNKYILIACALLLAGGYGGYSYYTSTKAAATATVKTAQVSFGKLQSKVSATGSLSAIDNVDISSKITGRIVDVLVKENDHVEAGQLLLRLDDTSLKATEVQKQAALEDASLTLNRNRQLLETGAVSQQVYDTAYVNYKVAKAAYDQAVSNTNDTYIYTPIDGYIIGKPKEVGTTISSGISEPQVIMSVANLDKMQIETLVDESDIGQIKVGQKVEFTVDSFTDEIFTGKVRLISRSATTTNNVIYYTVYVDVEDSKNKLFPTMTARTEIIIDEADNTLIVPNNCIYKDGEKRYVMLYDAKTKETKNVYVEAGLSDDDSTAIKANSELREGDVLLVRQNKAKQTMAQGGPPPHM